MLELFKVLVIVFVSGLVSYWLVARLTPPRPPQVSRERR